MRVNVEEWQRRQQGWEKILLRASAKQQVIHRELPLAEVCIDAADKVWDPEALFFWNASLSLSSLSLILPYFFQSSYHCLLTFDWVTDHVSPATASSKQAWESRDIDYFPHTNIYQHSSEIITSITTIGFQDLLLYKVDGQLKFNRDY